MVKEHLEYLICPVCKGSLKLQKEIYEGDLIKEGVLSCNCAKEYPIVNFIPRFVPKSNYADSFGFEWNMHKKTQFDSESGVEASKRRFYEETKNKNKNTNSSCNITSNNLVFYLNNS